MSKKIVGLFLGTAVGDAIGLPREGLSPKRANKLFGLKIHPALIVIPFIKRFSVCSDDTEHLWITARALIETQNQDVESFEKRLSILMKWWFLSFPVGAGKASLQSCFKLLLGISPKKSGIFSAGNGAVMRAPIIGAYYADNPDKMEAILKASTLMTHTDPRAYEGAWVIAKASSLLMQHDHEKAPVAIFFNEISSYIKNQELQENLNTAQTLLNEKKSLEEFLKCIHRDKKGISGYVNHTVPAVIYAWLNHYGNYQKTIEALVQVGGDTDTTAAIAGALAGMTTGKEKIPNDWLNSVCNNPLSIHKLEQLANALAVNSIQSIPKVNFFLLFIRNVFLLFIVLIHGFRRLAPPY